MAFDRLPAYVRPVELASGKRAYYWELPHWAKPTKAPASGKIAPTLRHGRVCPVTSEALGTDQAAAIRKASNLNEALAEWRKGEGSQGLVRSSVAWLFDWYRKQDRFTKNKAKTRTDYKKLMDMLVDFETKAGRPKLGKQMANKVDATVSDKLYKKLREKG